IRVYADAAQAPLPTQHFQLPRHMTLSLRFHNTHSEAQPEAEQEQEQVRVSVKSELPQHALAQSCTFLNELEWQNVNDIIKVLQEHPTWLAFFFRRLSLKSQEAHLLQHKFPYRKVAVVAATACAPAGESRHTVAAPPPTHFSLSRALVLPACTLVQCSSPTATYRAGA
ncbi:uncharacterized, partial [Tachysurus ichikawai]